MSDRFKTAIVRLLTTSPSVVGTGFFVGNRYILTCAHVVNDALGIADTTDDMPTAIIRLDFPFVAKGEYLTAKVIAWYPVANDNISDIAILKLLEDAIPNNCQSILTLKNHKLGHSFQAYGFPRGYDNRSIFTQGIIKAGLADGTVQIQECKIEQGFSGGPVWDEQEEAVVGMIVEVDTQDSSLAFFIPTNILRQAWPQLNGYCRRSQKPESIPSYLLPYSPDRDKQIWVLRDAIKKRVEKCPDKHRPLLCLIHGDESQCHGKLVERFIFDSKIMPKQVSETRPKFLHLPQISDDLRERISAGLKDLPDMSPILYSEIYTEDWQYYEKTDIIRDFIEFWANFDTPKHLLLVCLCFNYRRENFLTSIFHHYKNYKIRCIFKTLESEQPDVVVLPELLNIEKRDVENWARIYLENHFYEINPRIRDLFSKRKKIPMESLASQLAPIVKQYKQR